MLSRISNPVSSFRSPYAVKSRDTKSSATTYAPKDNSEPKSNEIPKFDDKKLASLLAIESGTEISTEKPINWGADGTSQLTAEQIDYLKSNYDITNMTEQDYYNLMSDLTNMNVLSGEEVINQQVAPIVVGASASSTQVGVAEGEYNNFQGNLLANTNSSLLNISNNLIALNNGDWYFSIQNLQQTNDNLLDQKHLYHKLSSIYSLLKRE